MQGRIREIRGNLRRRSWPGAADEEQEFAD
jgi:hypothetical protein